MISEAIEKGRVLRPFFYEKKEHIFNVTHLLQNVLSCNICIDEGVK